MATTNTTTTTKNPSSEDSTNAAQSNIIQTDDELRKIFNQFDENGDGYISATELAGVMESMGSSYTEDELKRVMEDIDTDKDGLISLSEFATLCKSSSTADVELKDAFDLYDQDKNGQISAAELHMVLNRLKMPCSVQDCEKMIKSVDSDGDSNVNFEEFKKMMSSSLGKASGP